MAANLAANLRSLRDRRSFTQMDLARLAGLPRSTIAQLETGQGNPTLAVLAQLAAAVKVSIEELLTSPHSPCQVFPRGSLPIEAKGGARVARLLPDPIPGMEIDRIELAAGGRMAGIPHRPGTREYLACEAGQLTLWTGGEAHRLGPGDVAAFPGDSAHSYQNEGRLVAVGFSVVTLAPL